MSKKSHPVLLSVAYAVVQAMLPPIGELFLTGAVHLLFLVVFLFQLVPWRQPRQAAATVAAYVGVLALAAALPFGVLDSKVDLRSRDVTLSELPGLLAANGHRTRSEPLPSLPIRLPTSQPSLKMLNHALQQQVGLELRLLPSCANAISISFLWGPRSGSGLYLTPIDFESMTRLNEALLAQEPNKGLQLPAGAPHTQP